MQCGLKARLLIRRKMASISKTKNSAAGAVYKLKLGQHPTVERAGHTAFIGCRTWHNCVAILQHAGIKLGLQT